MESRCSIGLPDHSVGELPNSGNRNSLSAQEQSFRMGLDPDGSGADPGLGMFGVAVNDALGGGPVDVLGANGDGMTLIGWAADGPGGSYEGTTPDFPATTYCYALTEAFPFVPRCCTAARAEPFELFRGATS